MCLACGQMLKGTEEKCPSCGAPIHARRAGGRSGKLTVAAILFMGLALLTGTQVAIALIAPDQPTDPDAAFGPTFALTGSVRFENGTAAGGVLVRLDANNATEVATGENGTFAFSRVVLGFHEVSFSLDNHTTVNYKVFVARPETVDAQLVPGSGVKTFEDDSYKSGRTTFLVAAVVFGILAIVLVGGAVACLRRRPYALALTASWLSLLEVIPTTGITIILSVILIVLVVRSKREFR